MSKINSHTSTLFHFTKDQNALFSILKQGLRLSFCKESFMEDVVIGIPMISFCDIPLMLCKEHRDKYGRYSIGFSKDAFTRLSDLTLAPLSYFNNNQVGMKQIIQSLVKDKNKSVGWFKQYEMHRNGIQQINYDECEWRILPNLQTKEVDYFWEIEEYEKWKDNRTDKFLDKNNSIVKFGVNDIRHIIVYQEQNIKSTVDRLSKLQTIGGNILTEDEKYLLVSKVISFDYINKDF